MDKFAAAVRLMLQIRCLRLQAIGFISEFRVSRKTWSPNALPILAGQRSCIINLLPDPGHRATPAYHQPLRSAGNSSTPTAQPFPPCSIVPAACTQLYIYWIVQPCLDLQGDRRRSFMDGSIQWLYNCTHSQDKMCMVCG
jgi:hypothetical protein